MEFLTLRQSAQIIQCHPDTLRRKIRRGRLTVFQNSLGHYLLSSEEVLRLRAERQTIREVQNGKLEKFEKETKLG